MTASRTNRISERWLQRNSLVSVSQDAVEGHGGRCTVEGQCPANGLQLYPTEGRID